MNSATCQFDQQCCLRQNSRVPTRRRYCRRCRTCCVFVLVLFLKIIKIMIKAGLKKPPCSISTKNFAMSYASTPVSKHKSTSRSVQACVDESSPELASRLASKAATRFESSSWYGIELTSRSTLASTPSISAGMWTQGEILTCRHARRLLRHRPIQRRKRKVRDNRSCLFVAAALLQCYDQSAADITCVI